MIEGISHTSYYIVAPEDTAIAQGSGQLEVLATPRLAAFMENAAMLTVAPSLGSGETTVGGMISITHLAPSPIGTEVAATAVLDKVEGQKLSFSVSVKDGDKLIGEAGKRDEARLCEFLDTRCTIIPRTMLWYAIEKFPEEKRQYYLKK